MKKIMILALLTYLPFRPTVSLLQKAQRLTTRRRLIALPIVGVGIVVAMETMAAARAGSTRTKITTDPLGIDPSL